MFYMKDANINVRVDDWLYSQIRELDINISELVRMAIINEIEKRRVQNITKNLGTASAAAKKMGIASVVSEIRRVRESR